MKSLSQHLQFLLPLAVGTLLLMLLAERAATLYSLWSAEPQATSKVTTTDPVVADVAPAAEKDYTKLAQLHLFGIPEAAPKAEPKTPVPDTRAQLTLHGVFVDGEQSGAIIGESSGRQHYVRLRGALPDGITLKEVHADHIILERKGQEEALRFSKVQSLVAAPEPEEIAPLRAEGEIQIEGQVNNLSDLAGAGLEQASRYLRVFPVQEDGIFLGYRILPGRQQMLYQKLGLRPGDVVTEVNGAPITESSGPSGFIQQISAQTGTTLTIRRGADIVQVQDGGS